MAIRITSLVYAGALAIVLIGCATKEAPAAPLKATAPAQPKQHYVANTQLYYGDRSNLVNQHVNFPFSPAPPPALSPAELVVDKWLRTNVLEIYGPNRSTVKHFPLARPFYEVRHQIATSSVFRLIQKMPKGGLLHSHLGAAGRIDWILDKALYFPDCHINWNTTNREEKGTLVFDSRSQLTPAAELLRNEGFKREFRQELTLGREDLNEDIWRPFARIFGKVSGLRNNLTVFHAYLVETFETLWKDGIYVAEFRDSVGPADADLTPHITVLTNIVAARNAIRSKYNTTNFHVRIIVHGVRNDPAERIHTRLRQVVSLRTQFPDLIAGFDLVGGEDDMPKATTQRRVLDLLPVLQRVLTNPAPVDPFEQKLFQHAGLTNSTDTVPDISFFLHDGESLWADNDNLIDAVMLNTPRIGHGFNLFRYPTLYPALKTKGIALEVCPISNQLLGLTPDLRLHPASGYIKAGIPCVLSSDDPLIFGNDGLSYDFWAAIVAWNLDLATVKQLARNSILHSSLSGPERQSLLSYWEARWNQFIHEAHDIIRSNNPTLWTDASSSIITHP